MSAKNIALALLLAILLTSLYGNNQSSRIEKKLDSLSGEIQWCVWHHEKYNTVIMKGSRSAERARRDIGRPSDEGDC